MTCGFTLQNGLTAGAADLGGAVLLAVPTPGVSAISAKSRRAIAPAHVHAAAHASAIEAGTWGEWMAYQPATPVFGTDRPNPRLPEGSP